MYRLLYHISYWVGGSQIRAGGAGTQPLSIADIRSTIGAARFGSDSPLRRSYAHSPLTWRLHRVTFANGLTVGNTAVVPGTHLLTIAQIRTGLFGAGANNIDATLLVYSKKG